MGETIYWSTLPDLKPVIQALDCPPETLMILESIPQAFLSPQERQEGLRFEKFNPGEDFNLWARGRIFHPQFELRWEREGEVFKVVYMGSKNLAELGFQEEKDLDLSHSSLVDYYLWGRKVEDEDLKKIGQPEGGTSAASQGLFVESQIPRLLYYPIEGKSRQKKKFRIRLKVKEYLDPDTAKQIYYRFVGLEEEL
jgi:hypothetical protein